jgi:predicted Zn-dependent protease
MQFSQQGVPASRFIDVIRPLLAKSGDKAVRLEGVGHDEVFAEKDPAWVEALAKLHEEHPDDVNATIKWVLAKYRVEGGYAALEAVNKLIKAKPDSRELRATRVSIILEDTSLGRTTSWKETVEDVKQFRSQFPEMAELQWMQGWLMVEGDQCQNAANLFRRLFDRYGIDPSIRLDWANAMACAGEHRAALAAYDELLYYMPKAVPVRYARALVRFRLGQSEPARVDLRRILTDDEEETAASVLRAAFAMNEGHHLEDAEKDLRKAITTTDDDPSAAFALGAGLLAQGRDAEAVEALLIARKYQKEELFSALLLNVALTKAGKTEEAKSVLKGIVNEYDDPSNWQMLLVKHFQGELSADDFLKAAEAGPEDTKWQRMGLSHAYVGLLAYAKGDKKDARRYFLTAPYLDRAWLEFSVIDAWQRAAEG